MIKERVKDLDMDSDLKEASEHRARDMVSAMLDLGKMQVRD